MSHVLVWLTGGSPPRWAFIVILVMAIALFPLALALGAPAWLAGGSPPRWEYFTAIAAVAVLWCWSRRIQRDPEVRAGGLVEALANALLELVRSLPVIGPLLAIVLRPLTTPPGYGVGLRRMIDPNDLAQLQPPPPLPDLEMDPRLELKECGPPIAHTPSQPPGRGHGVIVPLLIILASSALMPACTTWPGSTADEARRDAWSLAADEANEWIADAARGVFDAGKRCVKAGLRSSITSAIAAIVGGLAGGRLDTEDEWLTLGGQVARSWGTAAALCAVSELEASTRADPGGGSRPQAGERGMLVAAGFLREHAQLWAAAPDPRSRSSP